VSNDIILFPKIPEIDDFYSGIRAATPMNMNMRTREFAKGQVNPIGELRNLVREAVRRQFLEEESWLCLERSHLDLLRSLNFGPWM
jgi:hypothetical protein